MPSDPTGDCAPRISRSTCEARARGQAEDAGTPDEHRRVYGGGGKETVVDSGGDFSVRRRKGQGGAMPWEDDDDDGPVRLTV